jgi:hypothetical protein
MYRVRKKWADAASQIGAYDYYNNALYECNRHPGYGIYNDNGNVVYVYVPTMSYKAKVLKNNGAYKKGDKVTVTRNRQKQWVLKDGTVFPDKSYLDLQKQIYDASCRVSRECAEKWINSQDVKSQTEWLLWCNKYGQRVYVFRGRKGAWSLQKTCKCGTGNIEYGDGSDQGVSFGWKIYDKQKTYQGPRGIQKWNQHYTSEWGNSIHQGKTGEPSTHGCIALGETAAKWVFDNVPINSRVVVF